MNKNILKIKRLLKIYPFQPFNLTSGMSHWPTEMEISPTDYSEDRLTQLIKKCGETDISYCYFKGGKSIFYIQPILGANKWRGHFRLLFLLPDGVDGSKDQNQPSKIDRDNFILFLRGDNE